MLLVLRGGWVRIYVNLRVHNINDNRTLLDGEGDPWELWKKLIFNLTTKWYMHKPESVLDMDKILWDFESKIHQLIPTRRPDVTSVNKKGNLLYRGFCPPGISQSENQRKKTKRNSYIFREHSESCGTWRWQGYRLFSMPVPVLRG